MEDSEVIDPLYTVSAVCSSYTNPLAIAISVYIIIGQSPAEH